MTKAGACAEPPDPRNSLSMDTMHFQIVSHDVSGVRARTRTMAYNT